MKINAAEIKGAWRLGFSLDLHTTRSTPSGENEYGRMQFDTVRPEIAELLFQLKYRGDTTAVRKIVAAALPFIPKHLGTFDFVVPVPASSFRTVQPVILLATAIAAGLRVPVLDCITVTRATPQLKNVTDAAERTELLKGLYTVNPKVVSGKHILLFDDLFRSGSTLNAVTSVLRRAGSARVDVLTITRTRSNQ